MKLSSFWQSAELGGNPRVCGIMTLTLAQYTGDVIVIAVVNIDILPCYINQAAPSYYTFHSVNALHFYYLSCILELSG